MTEKAERELPVWNDEALSRLLGACDGYAHVLVSIRQSIGRIGGHYSPGIHPKHVRKLERRNAVLKPLQELCAATESNLRECQAAYQKQRARARRAFMEEK